MPIHDIYKDNNLRLGFKPWKGHVSKVPLEESSEIVQELNKPVVKVAEEKIRRIDDDGGLSVPTFSFGNIVYACLFGWWIALIYLLMGIVMFAVQLGDREYSDYSFVLARYFLWPFDKMIHEVLSENDPSYGSIWQPEPKTRFVGYETAETTLIGHNEPRRPGFSLGRFFWTVFALPILAFCHGLISFICGFLVVLMPMAKIHTIAISDVLIRVSPNQLRMTRASASAFTKGTTVKLFVIQASNIYFYKFKLFGMNIVLVNLLFFVLLTLTLPLVGSEPQVPAMTLFLMSCLSIIPLAYYIGMAIASIAAQSSHAVGAVLNATFGTIVEIILYCSALEKGLLPMVKGSIVGTLLACLLFIPGICMIVGGIKHSHQRFNKSSSGVTSSLLFVSIAGALSPSLFHKTFGLHQLECDYCSHLNALLSNTTDDNRTFIYNLTTNYSKFGNEYGCRSSDNMHKCNECRGCHYIQSIHSLYNDDVFNKHTRPLIYFCCAILPLTYIVGMIFSLRTHAHIHKQPIYDNDDDGPDADHAPHWTRKMAIAILLLSTVLLALVAEVLVESIRKLTSSDPESDDPGNIDNDKPEIFTQAIIGLTVVALVPDMAEIVNGIQFALQNNISLSIEIGNSIAVQVCMIQIPCIVLYSDCIAPLFRSEDKIDSRFTMIFNDIYMWSVLLSVLVMNYTMKDGQCDYFQGTTLCT
eukprot:UC4_evm6s639